jgi:hypothetical protein
MAKQRRSKSTIIDMRRTAILLSVISLVAFPVWAALADEEPESSVKSQSTEPRPKNSAAQPSGDKEGARLDSLHRGVDSKGNGEKRTQEHHLLKGQPLRDTKMRKTPPQPSSAKQRAAGQTGHTLYESHVQGTRELPEARLPHSGARPRAASPPIGATTHLSTPVDVLSHTSPAPALIPRTPTPARIGGTPGANTQTTAELNGTRLQRKP